MLVHKRYFWLVITILFSALFITLAYKGLCYYEDGEDTYCAIIMHGDFTGTPETLPNTSGFWIGLPYLIKRLFEWNANFDWYATFIALGYLLLIFQIAQAMRVLGGYLKKITGKWPSIIILCSCALLFSETIFIWQLTRLSMLLTGMALFNIWLNLLPKEDGKRKLQFYYLFNLFSFGYASLIRLEPAMLNIAIVFPLFLLGLEVGIPTKKYRAYILPLAIIAVLYFIVNTPFNQSDRNYLAFRKYQFSFLDFKQPLSTLKLETQKDSMVFVAANKGFISDSSQVNPAFFKRIGILPMDKTPSSIPYYFRNLSSAPGKIKTACGKILNANPGLVLVYFFYLITGCIFVFSFARKRLLWYLLFHLWALLLIAGITSFMKMENRILVPMLWLFLLENLTWCALLTKDRIEFSKIKIVLLALGLLVILPATYADSVKTYKRWHARKIEDGALEKLIPAINKSPEKIIVVNDNPGGKFYMRPFKPRYVFENKKIICLNCFQLFWLPSYGPYLQSVCGTSDIVGVVKFLDEHRSNVLFISSGVRMDLMKSYFKIVYDIDMPFSTEPEVITTAKKRKNDNKVKLYH